MKKFAPVFVLSFLMIGLTLLSLPQLAQADDPLIGEVIQYAGSNPPDGWLVADGSAVSRTLYADLFTIITTTYGEGDGSATFNLPNEQDHLPVGSVMPWPSSSIYGGETAAIPDGWLLLDGDAISRTEYVDLLYVIGTLYGSGDGSTTFNLPDAQKRFIIGAKDVCSSCPVILTSEIGGQGTITLTTNEMPPHNHALRLNDGGGTETGIGFNFTASGDYYTDIWIQSAGSGQPFDIVNPYVAMNWIIRAKPAPDFIIYTGVYSSPTPTPTPTATPSTTYLPYIYTHTLGSGHELHVPVQASFGQLIISGVILALIAVGVLWFIYGAVHQ